MTTFTSSDAWFDNCREIILNGEQSATIITSLCRTFVEEGPFDLVWYGEPCLDSGRIIPVNVYPDEKAFPDILGFEKDSNHETPSSLAWHQNRMIRICGISSDNDFSKWAIVAISQGFDSVITLPVKNNLHSRGVLTLYSSGGFLVTDIIAHRLEDLASYLGRILELLGEIVKKENKFSELAVHEKMYRSVFENTGTGTIIIDHDMTILYANDKFLDMTGYKREETENKMKWSDFVVQEDNDRMRRYHSGRREKESCVPTEYECRIKDRSGRVKFIYMKVGMIPGSLRSIASFMDITAWKIAENQLKESEAKYRKLFDFSNDSIFILREGICIDCNIKTEALFGACRDNIIGKTPADFSPDYQPDGRRSDEKAKEIIEQVLNDIPQSFEWLHVRPDGTQIVCEVALTRILIENDICILGSTRNISARKKSEEEMARLATVIDQAAEEVIITDINGIIEYVNPAFEIITGYTPDEVIGKKPSIMKSGKHSSHFYKKMWAKLLNGEVWRGVIINRIKSGDEIIEDSIISPIRGKDGKIIAFMAAKRDVTEEYALHEQLKTREEHFRAIFEKAPYAITIRNFDDGKYSSVNPAFERLTGYSRNDIIGRTPKDIGLLSSNYDREKFIERLVKDGFVENHLLTATTVNGEMIHSIISSVTINSDGRKSILSMIVDITEEKRLEEQLRQSQKMEVMGQLAGGVAHDFNNLLSGIMGNAELLAIYLKDDSPLKKYAVSIIKGAEIAAGLTKKLLAFSRKTQMVSRPIDIHEPIRAAIALLERSIDKRISIETDFKSCSPIVTGDINLLQNVFINLAVNARDAMPDGGRIVFTTLDITLDDAFCKSLNYAVEPGKFVEIDIADTGLGISPEIISKIFEPFFTTKDIGKGTGLGLSAVYGSVKEHHGAISVHSEKGAGTIFKIYLPSAKSGEYPRAKQQEETVMGRGCILVVDDEDAVRSTAAELLLSIGYNVLTACDGREAMEIFTKEKNEITAVFLDMVMPGITGIEAFRLLKQIDPDVKVVFTSGLTQEINLLDKNDLGSYQFIQKPYKLAELSRVISNIKKA